MTAIIEFASTAGPQQSLTVFDQGMAIDRWESDGGAVWFTAPASRRRRAGAAARS
ncbi:Uncharacterised protein [Mycolicibacterium gilvum]|uniref:Uncharacterized protein n=1 Tax=Mycolicibacterium gilvum TaxID=1804 RepID=A0A378SU43_9MYCO|nr:Uncharacterised protein [Mycolicibacterium gilvum]